MIRILQTGFDTIDIFTGQAHSRADLIQGIESVNTEKGGPRTEEFLKVCMSVRGLIILVAQSTLSTHSMASDRQSMTCSD